MGKAVNKHDLSEILGISERSLTEWQKDGMPVVEYGEVRGEANTYDTEAVIRWWLEREVSRRSDKSAFDKLNEVRAKREELGYRRELGEIVDVKDIRPAFRRYVSDVMAVLVGMPDKYAQVIELTAGINGKHQVLQDMIGELRDQLGNYEFCAAPAAGGDSRATQPAEDHAGAVG